MWRYRSRPLRRLVAGVVLLLAAAPAASAAGVEAEVRSVRSATALDLEDGTRLRLAGIHVPAGQEAAALALLQRVVRPPARVEMEAPGGPDRYGRLPVQVTTPDGEWLQGRLLEAGLAHVNGEHGLAGRARAMLDLERRARLARRGLWGRPGAPLFDAGGREPPVGRFAIVRGRITAAGGSRSYVYLNFGEDWRRDFTLRIRRPELVEVLGRSAAEELIGRVVEARGVVMAAGGPLIELSQPEQIEVLE